MADRPPLTVSVICDCTLSVSRRAVLRKGYPAGCMNESALHCEASMSIGGDDFTFSKALAASITRAASKQTYYTVRFLVDRDRIPDAYRAYAYFRWVDDRLDRGVTEQSERIAFVDRQRALMDRCYQGEWPLDPTVEERMLVDLIRRDR